METLVTGVMRMCGVDEGMTTMCDNLLDPVLLSKHQATGAGGICNKDFNQ